MPRQNPGSKPQKHIPRRASNAKRIDRRARCWIRGVERHAANKAAQRQREVFNAGLRADGLPTAWERACAQRRARRAATRAVLGGKS